MKRAFITFIDGDLFQDLATILNDSIKKYSNYELIIYTKKDFDLTFSFDTSKGYSYKILACLKALNEYDEIVWIDSDCVVTKFIDKIWFESYKLKNYPLLPAARFNNFDEEKIYQKKYTKINQEAFDFFEMSVENYIYMQACFMLFNKKSKSFYEKVLSYFNDDYDANIFPFGDETIINCLLLKYNYNENLGDIFLCSNYFNKLLFNVIQLDNEREYFNYFNTFGIKNNNYSNILFFHGSKDTVLHKQILHAMSIKNIYSNIKINKNLIYINKLDYSLDFNDGAKFSLNENGSNEYDIVFLKNEKVIYESKLKSHMWSKVFKRYFIDWNIKVSKNNEILLDYKFNLKNKNVFIPFESDSLGDNLAWIPYVEEFRKKHDCNVYCYSKFSFLFKEGYPKINFIDKNYSYCEFFATYKIGYFIDNSDSIDCDVRTISLQNIACRILGLEYKEIRPKLNIQKQTNKEKSICISVHSTSQCKYWNNETGWIKTVKYLKNLGYKVYCIDKNYSFGNDQKMNFIPHNCIDKTGDIPLQERIKLICNSDFFIGLGSGLSWLAWSCNKPVILISGFSDPISEFNTKYRVHNKNVCNSCWNDSSVEFDKSNWMWCPRNKNFECSKEITFAMVKEKIDQVINDLNEEIDKKNISIDSELNKTKNKLVIKFPTRNRPEKFKNVFQKYIDMLSNKHEVEFIITMDEDDSTMNNQEIKNWLDEKKQKNNIKYFYGNSKSKVEACNADMQGVDGDVLLLAQDDMIPIAKDYDDIIFETFKKSFPDFDGAIKFWDGYRSIEDTLITLMIVGFKLYRKFGYIYHPSYKSVYCDNEQTEIFIKLGKYINSPICIMKHDWVPESFDYLHARNESDELYKIDGKNFNDRKTRNFELKI